MALNMVDPTDFADGEDAFGTDVVAEIQNILTNGTDVAFPLTKNVEGGGFNITNLASLSVSSSVIFSNVGSNPSVAGQLSRNGTILKFYDGSTARVNQCLHALGQSGPLLNIATETALYDFTVPAGSLGTVNKLQVLIMFRAGLLNNAIVTILPYFGGVQGGTIAIGNNSGSTAALTLVPLLLTLSASSVSAQILTIEGHITNNVSNAADAFGSLNPNLAQVTAFTANSAIAQALQVNVLFSAADAANQCDYVSLMTVLTG